MKTVPEIATIPVSEIQFAPYNPRKDLKPGDPEYDALRRSIEQFGNVVPVVWNKRTGNLVGGHQRMKVLLELGATEVPAVVVDLDLVQEKTLNVALNKIQGEWDRDLLGQLLKELDAEGTLELTGFEHSEFEALLYSLGIHESLISDVDDTKSAPKREPYRKVDHKTLTIWHATVGDMINCRDEFNYLFSFGALQGKPPKRSKPPNSMNFVDSGMLVGARKEGLAFLDRQQELIAYAARCDADWVAMLDVPMIPEVLEPLGMGFEEAYGYHLRNAREFAELSVPMRRVYVIQGQEVRDYVRCAHDMKRFITADDVVAVGTVKNKSSDWEHVTSIVQEVAKVFPENDLHLFGITSPYTVAKCVELGVTSCDSATASLAISKGNIFHSMRKTENRPGYALNSVAMSEALFAGERISVQLRQMMSMFAFNAEMLEFAVRCTVEEVLRDGGEKENDD